MRPLDLQLDHLPLKMFGDLHGEVCGFVAQLDLHKHTHVDKLTQCHCMMSMSVKMCVAVLLCHSNERGVDQVEAVSLFACFDLALNCSKFTCIMSDET